MPRKKNDKKLTDGYLPILLQPERLVNIFYGTGLKDRILILYKIIFNSYKKYGFNKVDYTEYVTLHNSLVNKIFGEDKASKAIKMMVNNGLLEMIEGYYDKENPYNSYPRKFRIPPALLDLQLFNNSRLYRKVDILDKKAYNAYNCYKIEKLKQILSKSNCEVLKRLAYYTQDVYLELDSPQAKQLIESNNMNMVKQGTSYEEFLEQINVRDIEWFKRDHYGRVHFAWVSLDKRCHPLIRFKKFEQESCAEIDIANSQPFFSSIINEDVIINLLPEAYDTVAGINFLTSQWYEYRRICKKGQFYENWIKALQDFFGQDWLNILAKQQQDSFILKLSKYETRLAKWEKNSTGCKPKKPKLKADLSKCINDPRKAAKILFYQVIFNTQSETNSISQCFKNWMPDVWHAFKEIKSRYTPHNPSIKNKAGRGSYTNLAWIMQRLESRVVVDTCINDLLNASITQVIPRHDSILAPASLLGTVETYLIDAFIKNNLPVPKIKWSADDDRDIISTNELLAKVA